MELVADLPDALQNDLNAYKSECLAIDHSLTPFTLDIDSSDFSNYKMKLDGFKVGIGIRSGFVPHTTFWLVDEDRIIGVSNLRHELTERLRNFGGSIGYSIRPSERNHGYATRLLALTLEVARRQGIAEILLTCNKHNVASARTILSNGGILISEGLIENTPIQRYQIG